MSNKNLYYTIDENTNKQEFKHTNESTSETTNETANENNKKLKNDRNSDSDNVDLFYEELMEQVIMIS